jgi:hypothetical protein
MPSVLTQQGDVMPTPEQLTVYVDVLAHEDSPEYGQTLITIPKDDPNRAGFLANCEIYFKGVARVADASKFAQAAKQTPWDASDDGA